MKLITLSWIRNEADVIEAFVRHHCAFVDRMIIVCNRCTDNTVEILRQLQKEGLPIDVREDPSFDNKQSDAVNVLLHDLQCDDDDWILPLDGDEFFATDHERGIVNALAEFPPEVISLPWRTYIPTPADPEEPHVLRRMRYRRVIEGSQWYKVLFPGRLIRDAERIELSFGSHSLLGPDGVLPMRPADHLFLGHFPVRTAEQIMTKVYGGRLSYLAYPKSTSEGIFQWTLLFEEFKEGVRPNRQRLMEIALEYAGTKQWRQVVAVEHTADEAPPELILDPIESSAPLRYPARTLHPWKLLAETAEWLARERGTAYAARHG